MESMTVFYSKRTGSIKEICGGEQTMAYFGEEELDFNEIYDFVVMEYDSFIMMNIDKMHVVEGIAKMKDLSVPNKYL